MNYQNIKIENLIPHPSNPRKDLGDLTELADSIREKGILQNLTVVPAEEDGKYTIIIGHRRTAAAKLAGLTELPCVITEMSEADQIKTMLLENIQRNDLSVFEEACSFKQLTLDFGETAESIAKTTGFSVSTIRHRIRLSELDKDIFKKTESLSPKLGDYMKLERIKSISLRNKALELIGTRNFEQTIESFVAKEKRMEVCDTVIAIIKDWGGVKVDKKEFDVSGLTYKWFSVYSNANPEDLKKPDDVEEGSSLYFTVDDYGISLYYKGVKPVIDPEYEEEKVKSKALNELVEATGEKHYKLRRDFIESFSASKKNCETILKFVLTMNAKYARTEYGLAERMSKILSIPLDTTSYTHTLSTPDYLEVIEKDPYHTMLVKAFAMYDSPNSDYYRSAYDAETRLSRPEFSSNDVLDDVYDFLQALGYEVSDEEVWAREGSLLEHLKMEDAA